MSEERDTGAVFNEGLQPIMDETPEPADWESVQFEMGSTPQGRGRGWLIAAAAAVVVLVGVGSVALLGRVGGTDDATVGDTATTSAAHDTAFSIVGQWVFESWQEGDEQIAVEVGVNAAGGAVARIRSRRCVHGIDGMQLDQPDGLRVLGWLPHPWRGDSDRARL